MLAVQTLSGLRCQFECTVLTRDLSAQAQEGGLSGHVVMYALKCLGLCVVM